MGTTRNQAEHAFSLYNSGDIDSFMDVYAGDALLRVPEGEFEGRAAIRRFWAEQFSEFPDSHIAVEVLVEQDDTIAAEFTYTGTNTGPMVTPDGRTMPATGKRIQMQGMQLLQLREGRIVRHAVYHDEVAAIAQLGLMPSVVTA